MARCGACNKFVGYEEEEPEVSALAFNEGTVTVEIRIVNACDQCGSELREASFQLDATLADDWKAHHGDGHDLDVEEESVERTSRQDGKPGTPSRYRRTFYGARVEAKVVCSCGQYEETVTLEDDVMASGMDEL